MESGEQTRKEKTRRESDRRSTLRMRLRFERRSTLALPVSVCIRAQMLLRSLTCSAACPTAYSFRSMWCCCSMTLAGMACPWWSRSSVGTTTRGASSPAQPTLIEPVPMSSTITSGELSRELDAEEDEPDIPTPPPPPAPPRAAPPPAALSSRLMLFVFV